MTHYTIHYSRFFNVIYIPATPDWAPDHICVSDNKNEMILKNIEVIIDRKNKRFQFQFRSLKG